MRLLKNLSIEAGKLKSKVNKWVGGDPVADLPSDFNHFTSGLVRRVSPYTMTSPERIFSIESAARYILRHDIPGAFVECGVWRGGSMMAAALTLLDEGRTDRELYLFDTFEGMPEPTAEDVSATGKPALPSWRKRQVDGKSTWCLAELDEVRANLATTGYDESRLHFVKGMVEDTLPAAALGDIALLRLDTDWYDSTKCELEHLFPRLVPGGVLIIDDYARWQGCRKAVDEYFAANQVAMLLGRIDTYACIGVRR